MAIYLSECGFIRICRFRRRLPGRKFPPGIRRELGVVDFKTPGVVDLFTTTPCSPPQRGGETRIANSTPGIRGVRGGRSLPPPLVPLLREEGRPGFRTPSGITRGRPTQGSALRQTDRLSCKAKPYPNGRLSRMLEKAPIHKLRGGWRRGRGPVKLGANRASSAKSDHLTV